MTGEIAVGMVSRTRSWAMSWPLVAMMQSYYSVTFRMGVQNQNQTTGSRTTSDPTTKACQRQC
jgi:hypothetical protein